MEGKKEMLTVIAWHLCQTGKEEVEVAKWGESEKNKVEIRSGDGGRGG